MQIIILLIAMVVIGLVMAALAGLIWKGERPYGTGGDYMAAVITAVVVGLIDWYVIPAMGFSQTWQLIGVATEPAILALVVLWVMRRIKK